MTIERQQAIIRGQSLHRLVLHPAGPPKGGLVFFHGQGDFIDRYPTILEGFVNAGYQCILTDLPGHGRSPGKRGHVPGLDFIDDLLAESLTHLNGPLIIAGHSMGGLMALRLILLQPHLFHAAWFSSPLLKILTRTNLLLASLLPFVAKLVPRLTISTGVTSAQCGDFADGNRAENSDHEALYHSRISLAWGHDLCKASEVLWNQIHTLTNTKNILFTQGDQDPICPSITLGQLLQKATSGQPQLRIIPGARHEPFSGSTREEFLTQLNSWIDQKFLQE